MRKVTIVTSMVLGLVYAGGDIGVITKFETNDYKKADTEAVQQVLPIPTKCPDLPIAETYPLEPCPVCKDKVVYKDKIIYKDKVVYKEKKVFVKAKPKPKGDLYVGIGGSAINYKCKCNGKSKDNVYNGTIARVGYSVNEYLDLEARGSVTFPKLKLKRAAVFAKPTISVSDDINLYTLIGYGKTKFIKKAYNSVAFGAGIETKDKLGLFFDYEDYGKNVRSINAGVKYSF